MRKFNTQIILVSGQMIPNVTPVIDDAIRPNKVILCVSNAMQSRGDSLQAFFQSKRIETEIFSLGSAYDFSELKNRFLELAARFDDNSQVAVNLTGGTKLMTIAAQFVLGDDFSCFYVVPDEDNIVMLNTEPGEKYELRNRLNLTDYFAIHGYRVENLVKQKTVSEQDDRLFKNLLNDYDKYRDSLGLLNYLADQAEKAYSLKIRYEIAEKDWDIMQLFMDHGAIKYYDDKMIEFANSSSRKFCKGLWLEMATYQAIKMVDQELSLQDFACSIEITSSSGIKNEIDAAFLYNNNLYIIECKTATMTAKGSDVLYKLDTIKSYAGMLTRSIVVTFKPLSGYDKGRAADLKIKIIEGLALKNLSKNILKFVETGK